MADAIYAVPWTATFGTMVLTMWTVMMAAMMVPTSLPMLLLVFRLKPPEGGSSWSRTLAFALGYLLIWVSFGSLLTGVQWLLNGMAMGHGVDLGPASVFGAAVLMLAGLYQYSPWKSACLRHCQTPLGFLLSHWRDGGVGALSMGLEHGLFCLGCCWMLMLLMLVGGAMNLLWMSGITVYLFLERSLPARLRLERVSGSLLICAGIAFAVLGAP